MRRIRQPLAASIAALAPATGQNLFAAPAAAGEGDAAAALAEILRDETAREALIARLLAEAEAPAATPEPETAPLLQLSLARQIAEYTRESAEAASGFVLTLTRSAGDVLGVFTGESGVNWPELQAALTAVGLVVAVTLGMFFALRLLSDRIFRAISERSRAGGGWLISAARLLAFSVTDALVILLAWAAGYVVALATGVVGSMDFRQSLFLNAFLLIEMTKVVLRAVCVPRHGRLRFAPMGDETAAYWYFWGSRLVSLLGYGLLLVVPIVNDTVSPVVGHSLSLLIVVTALFTALLIVLQNRKPVRAALRARHDRNPADVLGRFSAGLGAVWHWLAIAYLVALFVIWQASPEDALPFMLQATGQSLLAVIAGVVATVLISRGITGGMRLPPDLRRSLPLLEDRLNAFVPTVLQGVRLAVALAVLVAVAQAWQVVDFLGWLASEAGGAVASRVISAGVVVLVAVLLWLGVSSFVEYRLNPEVGRPPSARERTLLALFRNAFMVVLVVIATMLALSQLGVNIAPLLAGAGVIGLAVGFGAQRLVQDVITGAFIQIENAMNEGDVVTAGGVTGVVERLTIRSVGLRDLSGTYHVIPFSSVDSVSNFMKGFGYHVADIGVAYREDVAEVKRLMAEAFERLCAGPHGPEVAGAFEMHGVVALGDSAVVVRGRIRTRPGMQWAVGRAYTELVKQVFDEAGVEIPFPHMTLYMGQDKDGSAPPLHLQRALPAGSSAAPEAPALPSRSAATPG